MRLCLATRLLGNGGAPDRGALTRKKKRQSERPPRNSAETETPIKLTLQLTLRRTTAALLSTTWRGAGARVCAASVGPFRRGRVKRPLTRINTITDALADDARDRQRRRQIQRARGCPRRRQCTCARAWRSAWHARPRPRQPPTLSRSHVCTAETWPRTHACVKSLRGSCAAPVQ